jgi:hypothetical protein
MHLYALLANTRGFCFVEARVVRSIILLRIIYLDVVYYG